MTPDELRAAIARGELSLDDPDVRRMAAKVLNLPESKPKDDGTAFLANVIEKIDAAKRATPVKRSTPPTGRITSSRPAPRSRRLPDSARLVSWNGKTAVWTTLPKEK